MKFHFEIKRGDLALFNVSGETLEAMAEGLKDLAAFRFEDTQPARLHNATGAPAFCGPTALSMIAGISREEATRTIQKIRRSSAPVSCVWIGEMTRSLEALGFDAALIERPQGKKTLARVLRERSDPRQCLLILVTRHYVVARGAQGGCSWTKGKLVALPDMPTRRKGVHEVWRITKR